MLGRGRKASHVSHVNGTGSEVGERMASGVRKGYEGHLV